MKHVNQTAAALTAVALITASGCSTSRSASATAATFDAQGGGRVTCLAHQTHRPTAIFGPGRQQRTGAVLVVLHYYTANGTDRFCDGHAPTAIDREWTSLYVTMGANPSNLGPSLR